MFTWLALTYSYRMDKQMVVTEVVRNVKIADIASDGPSLAVDTTALRPVTAPTASVDSNLFMSTMQAGQSRNVQRINSAPSSARWGTQPAANMQSTQLASPSRQSLLQSAPSDVVQNPLLLPGIMQNAPAQPLQADRDVMRDSMLGPSKEMQSVAKQITVRCLRRWDGLLGIRAGSDGLGRQSGIWRDKFDGVRYAVLLLAMRKLNEEMTSNLDHPGKCALPSSCARAAQP